MAFIKPMVEGAEAVAKNPTGAAQAAKTVLKWLMGYKKPIMDGAGNALRNSKTGAVEMERVGLGRWIADHKIFSTVVALPIVGRTGILQRYADFCTNGKGIVAGATEIAVDAAAGEDAYNKMVDKAGKAIDDATAAGKNFHAALREKYSSLSATAQNNFSAMMTPEQQQGEMTPEQMYNMNLAMTGAQMGGSTGPLRGWGNATGSFLENNTWNLAGLIPAAWMVLGRHGTLMRIAGGLLSGFLLNKMNLSMFPAGQQQNYNQRRQLTPQEQAYLQGRGMTPATAPMQQAPIPAVIEDDETVVRARHL